MAASYPYFAPYRIQHQNLNGPGDSRPTAINIIEDENLVNGLIGYTAIVTGAASGIGVETARALYAAGMNVYMFVRNIEKAQPVYDEILASLPNSQGRLHLLEAELSSLKSVQAAGERFLSQETKLSIFIANAGIMATPWSKTVEGFESQFGTNHMAHFLLLQMLLPALEESARSTNRCSRVVIVSSSGHKNCPPRATGDYDFGNGTTYDPWAGYGQSKTANIWTANQIDLLYGSKGVHGFSLHPGGTWTPLQKHVSEAQLKEWKSIPGVEKLVKSAAQGAATSVWAATATCWENKGGVYLEDCSVAYPEELAKEQDEGRNSLAGHAKWTYDRDGQQRLWRDSLDMLTSVGLL